MVDMFKITIKKALKQTTAVPLTVRGMEWGPLPETVCRMDAASERTWPYLQRVSGNGSQFMSRIRATLVNACYISLFR